MGASHRFVSSLASLRLLGLASVASLAWVLGLAAGGCGGTDNDFSEKPKAVIPEDNGPVDTKQSKSIRIGNYNTRNFFNDVIDGETPKLQEAEKVDLPSPAAYAAKLAAVAGVLRDLDADVVLLQEVENLAVLHNLIAEPALGGRFKEARLIPANDPRGIDVGVISRLPIASAITHQEEKIGFENESYSRDCLEVHVDFNSRDIVLLGIHFRSQKDDKPEKRLAEAKYTRRIADGIAIGDPRAGILILGDFNDTPGSAPINAIANGTVPFTNAVSLLPAPDAWTVSFGQREIFDDQWVNPIMDRFRDASSVTVLHGHTDVSDHAPVAVTYVVQ